MKWAFLPHGIMVAGATARDGGHSIDFHSWVLPPDENAAITTAGEGDVEAM